MKKIYLIGFMLLIILSSIPVISQEGEADLSINDQGSYRIEIIAYSFNFTIIDLNKVDQLVESGLSNQNARSNATFYDKIENLDYGRDITIIAKSADVQHGLLIDELGVDFILEPPEEGEEFGPEQIIHTTLPSVDITIRANCNIYCGAGHSDMQFEIIVGEGSNFGGEQIDIISDWRVWLLFGMFIATSAFIIGIAIINPKDTETHGED